MNSTVSIPMPLYTNIIAFCRNLGNIQIHNLVYNTHSFHLTGF